MADVKKVNSCPICHKLAPKQDNPYFPFCSKRCADIDLGHWFMQDYTISETIDSPSTDESILTTKKSED